MSQRRDRIWALGVWIFLALASRAGAQILIRDEFNLSPHSANYSGPDGFIETTDGNFVGWVRGATACPAVALVNRNTVAVTILHVLDQHLEGCEPQTLVEGRSGDFYGVTNSGGPFGYGTVFKVTPNGAFEVLHAFTGGADGGRPLGPLMLAANGVLYGTTAGGISSDYRGCCPPSASSTVFTVSDSGTVTNIANLSHIIGGIPGAYVYASGPLVQARDGRIYGTTSYGPMLPNGAVSRGAVYRFELDGSLALVHAFAAFGQPDQDGVSPAGGVIQAADGNFYGMTTRGGSNDNGTIFRITASGDLTTLYSFGSVAARLPLVDGGKEFLYSRSGNWFFRLSLSGEVKIFYGFGQTTTLTGSTPLLKSRDGRIWTFELSKAFSFSDGPAAVVSIDSPRAAQSVTEPFVVTGWAIDSSVYDNGIDTVHLWAFPDDGRPPIFVGASGYGTARPDVAQTYGAAYANSGFGLTVSSLTPGTYRLIAYAHSKVWEAFDQRSTASISVTVREGASSTPRIQIDSLFKGASVLSSFAVRGWAIDLAASDTTGVDAVHVYAYPNWSLSSAPTFLGTAVYGGSRVDVAAAFGQTFTASAFDLNANLPVGPYTIVAFAHSTVTGLFTAAAHEITVRPPGDPQMALDGPTNGSTVSQPFVVGGWAIDKDAANTSGVDAVHIWAFPATGAAPMFLGAATYGGYRHDVSVAIDPISAYACEYDGYLYRPERCPFGSSAFGLIVNALSPGTYDIVAYAHSSVTGTFSAQRQSRVTVQ